MNPNPSKIRLESGPLPGQVLQRCGTGAQVRLSGWCPESQALSVSLLSGDRPARQWSVSAEWTRDGSFAIELDALPSGGPYQLVLSGGGSRLAIGDLFVGDVWVLAGQSNMQGCGLLADAPEPDPLVRAFTMVRVWEEAREPLHFLRESPDPVHHGGQPLRGADAAGAKGREVRGTGPGLWFAKRMREKTGVPQGLVACAHGGTSMAQWDPALAMPPAMSGDCLYGSLLASLRLLGQPVAGVLWYQGCSDSYPAETGSYTSRMANLVAALRRDLAQADLPWLVVQIARETGRQEHPASWNTIQEAQRRLPESIDHLDVVAAADLEMDDWIHVSGADQHRLGERLALLAERLVLGLPGSLPAPQPGAARWADDDLSPAVEIEFSGIRDGLRSPGRALGFTLADAAGNEARLVYKTELRGHRVLLRLVSDELHGLHVHHGLGTEPVINTHDGRDLPVPVFGPLPIEGLPPVSKWFRRWLVGPVETGEDIAGLDRPEPDGRFGERHFAGWWMVNLHPEWQDKCGHAAFRSHFDVAEDMDLELRAGFDGPFRLWIDDRELMTFPQAGNPAVPDSVRVPARLSQGRHRVTVLMALNHGKAWGFFFRLARLHQTGLLPQPW